MKDININNMVRKRRKKVRWNFVTEKYWKIEMCYGCEVGGGNEEKMQRERW
mgnify:CR=1 FL=1